MPNVNEKLVALKKRTFLCQELIGRMDKWICRVQEYLSDPDVTFTSDQKIALLAAYDTIITKINTATSNLPTDITTFEPLPEEFE